MSSISAPPRSALEPRLEGGQPVPDRFEFTRCIAARGQAVEFSPQCRDLVVHRPRRGRRAVLRDVVLVLIRAVRHLVQHGLGVGPEPGDRPQHAAEHQRQQAQDLDRLRLRVVPLVRDLLRQDVHQPEEHDHGDRDDDDHEDCDVVRRRGQCVPRQERGLRSRCGQQCQQCRQCRSAATRHSRPSRVKRSWHVGTPRSCCLAIRSHAGLPSPGTGAGSPQPCNKVYVIASVRQNRSSTYLNGYPGSR